MRHYVERVVWSESDEYPDASVEFGWYDQWGEPLNAGDPDADACAKVRVWDWETGNYDVYLCPLETYWASITKVLEQIPGAGPAVDAVRKLEASVC